MMPPKSLLKSSSTLPVSAASSPLRRNFSSWQSGQKRKQQRQITQVICGHAMPIREVVTQHHGGVLVAIGPMQASQAVLVAKEFGEGDRGGMDSQQWKNREQDWFNAERRFIFAMPGRLKRD